MAGSGVQRNPLCHPSQPFPGSLGTVLSKPATRVLFDGNFLDRLLDSSDEERGAILTLVDAGALEFWISLEVLEELMGVEGTTRRGRLVRLAELVLRLARENVLQLGE